MIYILLNSTHLKVFSAQKNLSYEFLHLLGGKEASLESLQSAALSVLEKIKLPDNSRIRLILDYPFYEVKFINFPYLVKSNNVRKLFSHAMVNEFLTPLEQLNFGYSEHIQKNASYYSIFAYSRTFSDKVFQLLQDLGWSLQGVYPLSSWLFYYDIGYLKDALKENGQTLADDYTLLTIDKNMAYIFYCTGGIFQKHFFCSLQFDKTDDEKIKRIAHQIKLYGFSTLDNLNPAHLYVSLRQPALKEKLLEHIPNINHVLPRPDEYSYQDIDQIYSQLSDQKNLVDMLRVDNSFYKDLLISVPKIKASISLLLLSLVILVSGSVLKIMHYDEKNQLLNGNLLKTAKEYDSNLTGLDAASQQLSQQLAKYQEIWEIKKQFLTNDYNITKQLDRLHTALGGDSGVMLSRISISALSKEMQGFAPLEYDLDELSKRLQTTFPGFELEKNVKVVRDLQQFSIILN